MSKIPCSSPAVCCWAPGGRQSHLLGLPFFGCVWISSPNRLVLKITFPLKTLDYSQVYNYIYLPLSNKARKAITFNQHSIIIQPATHKTSPFSLRQRVAHGLVQTSGPKGHHRITHLGQATEASVNRAATHGRLATGSGYCKGVISRVFTNFCRIFVT